MSFRQVKAGFNRLSPKGKKYFIWSIIALVTCLLAAWAYNSRVDGRKNASVTSIIKKEEGARFDPDLMSKTALREQRRQMEDMQKEILQAKQLINQLQKKMGENPSLHIAKPAEADAPDPPQHHTAQPPPPLTPAQVNPPSEGGDGLPEIPSADQVEQSATLGPDGQPLVVPLAPNAHGARSAAPAAAPHRNQNKRNQQSGLIVLSNPAAKDKAALANKGRTVYLPPSFMEAMLLTGFDAATSGQGKSDPEPMLLRVQTPAVLPNDIKADLAGCFVVAEAVGRLDKERADVRTVSLACLNNAGDAVIDTPIKGFVTDSDSKVGLSGRVVSRMGAAVARTFVAGLFEGAGDALKQSSQTTAVSPLGTTTIIDSSQVGKSALGTGLSESANKLSDFYLNLAKQATPVIEVGAEKRITVIISEGKELEIKSLKHEEAYQQQGSRPRG